MNSNDDNSSNSGTGKESQNRSVFRDFTFGQIEAMQMRSEKDPSSKGTFLGTCTSHGDGTSKNTVRSDHGRVVNNDGKGSSDRINIWSNMTKRGYDWTQNREERWSEQGATRSYSFRGGCESIKLFTRGCYYESEYNLKVLRRNPRIIVYSLLVWVVLLTTSLLIFEAYCSRETERARHNASWEAYETAHWLSSELSEALIPLRSLQQAVMYSDYFKSLPHEIKNYGEEDAAPAIFGPKSTTEKDYRNVTGICDRSEIQGAFHNIVEGINKNFDEKGSIFSYRLAPYGVFCLSDPLADDDLFSSGVFNDTSHIGWDPQYSTNTMWRSIFNDIFDDGNLINIHGPMDNFIDDGVEVFCAHLAVNIPGYQLKIKDGGVVSSWGFVMQLMNWTHVKEKSGIYKHFERRKVSFHLTRKDTIYDAVQGKYIEQNITIAKSYHRHPLKGINLDDNSEHIMGDYNSVAITIMTPNGEWTNRVLIDCYLSSPFLYGRIAIVFCTFIVMILFALMLLERQLHKNLLFKIMPKDAVDKLNRNQTVVEHYNIVTVFFTDIVGFTSMVSEMRPLQVMKMLNELYSQFDKIVKKYDLYKVETVGGAYMVVAGAPNRIPAPQAAERVALLALELVELVKNFETSNGDRIVVRAGIASGPAVGGVVGKAMPHYCFFGDTVNMASRMESTSREMMIQCSDFTVRLLQDSPKFSFTLEERHDYEVNCLDGNGEVIASAYWLKTVQGLRAEDKPQPVEPNASLSLDPVLLSIALSQQEWTNIGQSNSSLVAATSNMKIMVSRISAILEHLLEMSFEERSNRTEFSPKARNELHAYVHEIACFYNNVNYHNFEHASHVTISMYKLLSSIVESRHESKGVEMGNNFSDGIVQNSFARFCLVYSCLIHDVEHTGQSNVILAAKNHPVAKKFPKSSAERNSIDIALDLLFHSRFTHLRRAMIPGIEERFEFGRIIFWSILCTDIATPENITAIQLRFNVTMTNYNRGQTVMKIGEIVEADANFDPSLCPLQQHHKAIKKCLRLTNKNIIDNSSEMQITQLKLQSCVTVEHFMQVSDVSHLMQGWENFIKFNYRLYKELMCCYEQGSMPDPSDTWCNSQVGFLTNYVMPLAERTESICGYSYSKIGLLSNAKSRLDEWEKHGHAVTSIFISGHANGEHETSVLAKCRLATLGAT